MSDIAAVPLWKRHEFWGSVFKGASLAIIAVSFFASLKVDIAVLKSDQISMQKDIDITASRVEKIYDRFVVITSAERDF